MTETEARGAARAFWGSAIAHGAIVAVFAALSLARGCARPPKPRELITYIDVAAAAPRAAEFPALVEPPPPPPAPAPRPAASRPPEPPAPPREIPVPEPRPRPPPPPPAPPRPRPPRVERPAAPPRPALTRQQIAEQLARGLPASAAAPQNDFPFGWYFALVRQTLYDAWIQPSGISSAAGRTALVTIRVERDGTISRRQLVKSSGDARMDDSVLQAVNSVKKIRPLPDQYRGAYRDITVEFELTNP